LTRAFEAAYATDAARALNALAADVGAPPPARCALGVAVDDEPLLAVARGPDGALAWHLGRRSSSALDAATLVPASVREVLRGCDQVAVFAPPPLNGLPGLLPPELAWSYRIAAGTATAAATTHRRVVVANPTPPA